MIEKLTNTIQKHPLLILIMFVIAVLSGAMTIALGWNQFYDDYLSKKVEIPVWFFAISLIIAAIIPNLILRPKKNKPGEWEYFEGKDFGTQVIVADGKNFKRCTFDNTELVYEGREPVAFSECTFKQPRFRWGGPAATTMHLLTVMYQDPGFRPMVEESLENIRRGAMPTANHPFQAG